MKLIQLTDIHLTTPGETIAGRDPNANFEAALEHVLTHHADAELMAITGDLSDWGDREDYERLKRRLSAFALPTALMIGNHDRRDVFLQVFPELADPNGFVQSARDANMGRCLFLDTNEPATHAGRYCEARQAWLADALDAGPGPFLIFMHHNPIPTGIGPMDQIGLMDAEAFAAVIRPRQRKIRHIFHGHCHYAMTGSLCGVPVSSLRGTNHAGWPNFAEKTLLSGSDLPPSYGVALFGPETTTVHMVEFGYDGPVRVEGSPDYAEWDRETMAR